MSELFNNLGKALDPNRKPQMVEMPVYRDDLSGQMRMLYELDPVADEHKESMTDLVNFLEKLHRKVDLLDDNETTGEG